jgi:hemerythrin
MLRDAERLVSALGSGEHASLAGLAQQLLSTAREQFEAEERRLRESKAPSLVRHAREHQRFLADLGAMISLASRGDAGGVGALKPERWIPDWLNAHARTDRDLAA